MTESPNWTAMPAEGAVLISCTLEGCGKRGELILETVGNPRVVVELSRIVSFENLTGLRQDFLSVDDLDVRLRLTPLPNHEVRVLEARVDHWPDESLENLATSSISSTWSPNACCNVRLAFGT